MCWSFVGPSGDTEREVEGRARFSWDCFGGQGSEGENVRLDKGDEEERGMGEDRVGWGRMEGGRGRQI
eukprot:345323-Hanusia_phi.AAC.1